MHQSDWCDTLDIGEAVRIGGTSCTPSARMAPGPRDDHLHDKWGNGPQGLVNSYQPPFLPLVGFRRLVPPSKKLSLEDRT